MKPESTVRAIKAEQLSKIPRVREYKMILWHGIQLTVRTLLPLSETSQFVDSVANSCFDSERDIFFPEVFDFAFRVNVVTRYAAVELPEDIEEQYQIMYATDLYDVILNEVNRGQIEALRRAAEICTTAGSRA